MPTSDGNDHAEIAAIPHTDFPRTGVRDLLIRCDDGPIVFIYVTPRDARASDTAAANRLHSSARL